MTDTQWEDLKATIAGRGPSKTQAGFIIDSPWLPNWYGKSILDYFSSDEVWFRSNMKAITDFPEATFFPGFWSEFGMCTEPSAFGARCSFPPNEFPFAHKVIHESSDIDALELPDPRKDGLLPFVLNRLKINQDRMEEAGHQIRFAVARGPLNIASFLMGTTGFLTTLMLEPERADALVRKVTLFLKDWIQLQRETFPSIDGIFLLDDIIGFMGEPEFRAIGLPRFKELFDDDVAVRFLHNDAPCAQSAALLPEMGVNLYNMGTDITLSELQVLTENKVTLLGNIHPRDVLARGSPQDVTTATTSLIASLADRSHFILSCGGGMPPGVSSENIAAMLRAAGA
ncbi:MAG: uroporphyrinogen decarboxylase family protein [Rectinemataceae bacterium]